MKRAATATLWLLTAAAGFSGSGEPGQPPIVDEPPGGARPAQPPPLSPPRKTSATIGGVKISVSYSAPSIRKRVIFGGLVPYNRVWRAGANDATVLRTSGDLDLQGLRVPKGEYSLFVWVDERQWQLIVNRQTGQSGLEYHAERDVGRVAMTMSRVAKPLEMYRITLTKTAGASGQLQMAWENTVASVDFTVVAPR